LNVAATDLIMIATSIPNQTIYGTVICTGRLLNGVDITPIPEMGEICGQPPCCPPGRRRQTATISGLRIGQITQAGR